jgi:hypothetical protein
MSEKIVDALAKIKQLYLENVYNNDPRQKIVESQMNEIKKYSDNLKENIDSKEQILNAIKMWKNSGTPNSDESSNNVEMVMKAISPPVNENIFYSWRDSVNESILNEINDISDNKMVKEKKVDNYTGKKPVVTINPEMNIELNSESILIKSEQLSEEFVQESIDIATDYLIQEGLDDAAIEKLIEEIGPVEFTDWVMEFGFENLLEWRRGPDGSKVRGSQLSKSGKHISTLKGGAKSSAIRGTQEHKSRKSDRESTSTTSNMTSALRSQSNTSRTSKQSTQAKPAKKSSGFFANAMERDRAAKAKARELVGQTVKTAQNVGRTAAKFGSEVRAPFESKAGRNVQAAIIKGLRRGTAAARDVVAKEVARRRVATNEEFDIWVDNLLEEGYDLSEYTWDELYEEFEALSKRTELVERVIEFVRESR